MLRCAVCGKPVLKMTAWQQRRFDADPERYVYVCLEHVTPESDA